MVQNCDCLQGATIVTDPTDLEGSWSSIECLTDLTGVSIVDDNLITGSEDWIDSAFTSGQFRPCKITKITFVGTAVLYV